MLCPYNRRVSHALQVERADAAGGLGGALVWMMVLFRWLLSCTLAALLQQKAMVQHLAHIYIVESEPRGGGPHGGGRR